MQHVCCFKGTYFGRKSHFVSSESDVCQRLNEQIRTQSLFFTPCCENRIFIAIYVFMVFFNMFHEYFLVS